MIKNLIFDFGKVLVDYDFVRIITQFFDNKEDEKEFEQMFTCLDFLNRCDREDIPFRDLIKEMQQKNSKYEKQLQLYLDRYVDFVIGEMPGMKDLLIRYKKQGYKLYGLTNWCSKVHEVMKHYDIFNLLDGRVISSEEHLIKPDVAIYKRLCEKYNLKPEECVFADDREMNIEGALKAGMHGILFVDAEQYEAELKKLISKEAQ